jgi:Fe2+ or Zn2+ uptake regulation protein
MRRFDRRTDAGLVRRVPASRGRTLYDPRVTQHDHLVCRRCGAVEDVDASLALDAALASANRRGFAAERAEVVVHGLCADWRSRA